MDEHNKSVQKLIDLGFSHTDPYNDGWERIWFKDGLEIRELYGFLDTKLATKEVVDKIVAIFGRE